MKTQGFLLKHKAALRHLHLVDVRHYAGKVDIRRCNVPVSTGVRSDDLSD